MVFGLGNSSSRTEQEIDASTRTVTAAATADQARAFTNSLGGIKIDVAKKSDPTINNEFAFSDFGAIEAGAQVANKSIEALSETARQAQSNALSALDFASSSTEAAGPKSFNNLLLFGGVAVAAVAAVIIWR